MINLLKIKEYLVLMNEEMIEIDKSGKKILATIY